MTHSDSGLEGLKTRHDSMKLLCTLSVAINGGFIAFLQTAVGDRAEFVKQHSCPAAAILGAFALVVLLSLIASEGLARQMRGEELDIGRTLQWLVWAVYVVFIAGHAFIAFYLAMALP